MKRASVFLFLIILSLSFVSAVWWNPWSWFDKGVVLSADEEIILAPLDPCQDQPGCPVTIGGPLMCIPSCYGVICVDNDGNFVLPRGACAEPAFCVKQDTGCADGQQRWRLENTMPSTADCDGDGVNGFAGFAGVTGCPSAADCDDANDTIWEYKLYYTDVDGDLYVADTNGDGEITVGKYPVGDQIEVCVGSWTPPWGTLTPSAEPDCEDNDGAVSPGTVEVCYNLDDWDQPKDDDCDYDPVTKTSFRKRNCEDEDCIGDVSEVSGYRCCQGAPRLETSIDFSGWGGGGVNSCQDCVTDTNPLNLLFKILPKPNLANMGSCTNEDGSPVVYDAAIQEIGCCDGGCRILGRWYKDKDGDGRGDPADYKDVCSFFDLPLLTLPATWVSNKDDCDDNPAASDSVSGAACPDGTVIPNTDCVYGLGPTSTENCGICKWQKLVGYVDADGDENGIAPPVAVCSGSTLPSGYSDDALDCDDTDPAINWSNPYPLGANPLDNLCKRCGSEIDSSFLNPITGESMGDVAVGEEVFDPSLNPESFHNCYYCKYTDPDHPELGGTAEFILNNPPGDDDCFYCDSRTNTFEIDPLTPFFSISAPSSSWLVHRDDYTQPVPGAVLYKLTNLVVTPVPGGVQSSCADPAIGCYYTNNPAHSHSLEKVWWNGEAKDDCRTCIWKGPSYQYRKPAGEQAYFDDLQEDLPGSDENCSKCEVGPSGRMELLPDPSDSRFLGGTPFPPGGPSYLCKQCSATEPTWIVNDSDPRVSATGSGPGGNGIDHDAYIDTTCKRCEGGVLKNEANLAFANYCGGATVDPTNLCSTSPSLKPQFESRMCCGGAMYDSRTEGCCPTSITGDPSVDNYEGTPFTIGTGPSAQKCCREVVITANTKPALEFPESVWDAMSESEKSLKRLNSWRIIIKDNYNYVGATFSYAWEYAKYVYHSATLTDGIVNYSETTRVVVGTREADYCGGDGYGKKISSVGWSGWHPTITFTQDDICAPCQPSPKTNGLVMEGVEKLGSNLGFTAWMGARAGAFLMRYKNLDSIIGLRGYPRYNRICYNTTASIPRIGLPTGLSPRGKCGECDPSTNSKMDLSGEARWPLSAFGSWVWKIWKWKNNVAHCGNANIGNELSSRFASGKPSVSVEGGYYCSPDGECEISGPIIPGWLRYWLKKAMAAFEFYQVVHMMIDVVDKVQGGHPVATTGGAQMGTNVDENNAVVDVVNGADDLPMETKCALITNPTIRAMLGCPPLSP